MTSPDGEALLRHLRLACGNDVSAGQSSLKSADGGASQRLSWKPMPFYKGSGRRSARQSQPNEQPIRFGITVSASRLESSMEIVGKMSSQHLRIGFESDLTIRNATALKAALFERFQESGKVSLELNPDAAVDLSFLQLLSSARSSARASGGELTLAAPASPALRNVLLRAGFIESASAEDLKFWLHSENA